MAYYTGTTSTLSGLFSAIDTALTTNGWTVLETVSAQDKVYKSNGSDGKKSLTYRITGSAEPGYPTTSTARPEKFFPSIIARGYQRWSAGVGYNEYGKYGPRWVCTSSGTAAPDRTWVNFGDPTYETTFPLSGSKKFLHSVHFDGTPIDDALINFTTVFGFTNWGPYAYDGIRHFVEKPNAYVNLAGNVLTREPFVGEYRFHATMPFSVPVQNTPGAVVFNATTGNREFYFLISTSNLPDQWWKIDLDTGAVTRLAQPNWAATTTNGGAVVWNGADYLYCLKGNSTTDFSRYSISGNSWTSMTAPPTGRTDFSNRTGQHAYIPAAASNIGEDVIYIPLSTGNAIIYRYNVTSNNWTTAITMVNTHSGRVFIQYDGQKTMYVADSYHPSQYFHTNLATAPNTLVHNLNVETTTLDLTTSNALLQTGYAGVLRGHDSLSFKYWIFADSDGFSVATKVIDKIFWMHCGAYTTNYRQAVMKTSGSISPGTNISVSVDSTSGYRAGETILIFDPDSDKYEKVIILSITNSTSLVLSSVANSYTTNSLMGIDPDRQVITGTSGFAACLFDSKGWRTGGNASVYYTFPADIRTAIKTQTPVAAVKNLANNPRGTLLAMKMEIYNPEGGTVTGINMTGNESPLPTFERRGILKNVYAIPGADLPAPQSEQVVSTPDGDFLVLDQYPTNKMDRKYRILLGPLP